MPRLAIVVSAVGSTESLEGTLVSVLENRPADCEVIVALARPYNDPYDLKDEVRFLPPAKRATLTAALNAALAATRAPFVHLLASGCQVSEGWTEAALARFGDRQVGSVAPLVLDAQDEQRIFAAGVGYRSSGRRCLVGHGQKELSPEARQWIVGPCGFAAFYRKAALELAGGFSSMLGPRQADIDLALLLKRAGLSVALEPSARLKASPEVDRPLGALSEALADERLFWRNLATGKKVGAIVRHAGLVSVELLKSIPQPRLAAQLAGRFWACCEIGSHLRHQRLSAELTSRALPPRKPSSDQVRIDGSHEAPLRSDAPRVRQYAR